MTKSRFRAELRRGLGSWYLALEACSDIGLFWEDLLWASRYAVAYDTQSEGTRAIYLYEMMRCFGDVSEFICQLTRGAKQDIKDRGWRFAHEADILALMAGDGYETARQALEEVYALLLDAINTGWPRRSGIWPALDNFSALCVSVLTNALPLKKEAESFFLRVLADFGRMIQKRPWRQYCFEDDWFEQAAEERFGKARLHELLKDGENDPDISRYLRSRDRLEEERRTYQAGLTRGDGPMTAQSIYEMLRGGAIPGKTVPLMLVGRLEKEKRAGELAALGRMYAREPNESLRQRLLSLFRRKNDIAALEGEAIARLMSDVEGEHIELKEEVIRVLTGLRSTEAREWALARLRGDPKDADAICCLISNYRRGDRELLISLVRSLPVYETRGDWHAVFSDIRELIAADPAADEELSAALLPYIYRKGFCSECRLDTLELMADRGLVTPELLAECRHDCNMEIRAFAEAF